MSKELIGRLRYPTPELALLAAMAADRIEELERQLETERIRLAACGAAALGYFDGCKDEYKSASLDDILRLRNNLAERDAELVDCEEQIVMLRDALKHVIGMNHSFVTTKLCEAALAATKDLSGLILCDAEPVGAVLVRRDTREGIMFYSNDMIPDKANIKDRFELITVFEERKQS